MAVDTAAVAAAVAADPEVETALMVEQELNGDGLHLQQQLSTTP